MSRRVSAPSVSMLAVMFGYLSGDRTARADIIQQWVVGGAARSR